MYLVEDAEHDSQILMKMYHDLPSENSLFGDSGYTNYEVEDIFREAEQADL
ncbi:hypothetical protein GFO_0438 [Christiangramia forsetii KT0803]|uniref:Uncharacterized protein n=2 Tax=Christiangramia forsetii TaxID=411153 RepID=A0LYH5_CHRFK|nr:hypothetical protein GFO_0438 [Christiangramia forsetii KT0803]